jgi:hypothetical protein
MYHFSARVYGLKNSRLILHAVAGGPQQFYYPTRELLKYAIGALNAPSTKYRLRGLARRKRGYSNASLAIGYTSTRRGTLQVNLCQETICQSIGELSRVGLNSLEPHLSSSGPTQMQLRLSCA